MPLLKKSLMPLPNWERMNAKKENKYTNTQKSQRETGSPFCRGKFYDCSRGMSHKYSVCYYFRIPKILTFIYLNIPWKKTKHFFAFRIGSAG